MSLMTLYSLKINLIRHLWRQSHENMNKSETETFVACQVLRNKNKEINKLLTAAAENKIKELEDSLKLQSEGVEL